MPLGQLSSLDVGRRQVGGMVKWHLSCLTSSLGTQFCEFFQLLKQNWKSDSCGT